MTNIVSGAAVRIVIVDSHAIAREGIKAMLADSDEFQVVGECGNGLGAYVLADRLAPDVFLVDPAGLAADGAGLIRTLLRCLPGRAVVAFAAAPGRPVLDAFQAGARGVLLKTDGAEELTETLRAVHAGGWCLSRAACQMGFDRSIEVERPCCRRS